LRPLPKRPIQCRSTNVNGCGERYCNATCSERAWDIWHRSLCSAKMKELRVKCRPVESPSAKAPLYLVKIAGMTIQHAKYPCRYPGHRSVIPFKLVSSCLNGQM
jgi:hypothetical protein